MLGMGPYQASLVFLFQHFDNCQVIARRHFQFAVIDRESASLDQQLVEDAPEQTEQEFIQEPTEEIQQTNTSQDGPGF